MTVRHLRVEDAAPLADAVPVVALVRAVPPNDDITHWRRMAVQAGERLSYAENQCKDLRVAADDARARFSKYKSRLDAANARVNELQSQLITVGAERDALREQVAQQDVLARKVHEFRESLLHGPLWELFVELAVSPPSAGEGK